MKESEATLLAIKIKEMLVGTSFVVIAYKGKSTDYWTVRIYAMNSTTSGKLFKMAIGQIGDEFEVKIFRVAHKSVIEFFKVPSITQYREAV